MSKLEIPMPENRHKGTAKVIFDMMTENTGKHICDSGGFDKWPEVWVEHSDGEMDYLVVNLFSWLDEYLYHDKNLQRRFDRFNKRYDPENNASWLGVMEEFAESLDSEYRTVNTYNDDTLLSGIVQYVSFRDDDGDTKILMQHHCGCDARAGYTSPRAFSVDEIEIFEAAASEAFISCDCGDVSVFGGHTESDDLECKPFPTSWKPLRKDMVKCDKCGEKVIFSMARH